MICQYAVLAHYRHDVGSDTNGAEIEQRDKTREWDAIVLGKSLHEFETNATTAEILEGVGGVCALGVENSHGIWQFVIRYVVVADDEVDAQALGIGYLFDSLYAAVEHYDKLDALFGCIMQ